MNYITVIENKWRLAYDGMQYLVEEYHEGGDEVYSPHAKEVVKTKPKWKHTGKYYQNVGQAVVWVAKHTASSEAKDLREFVEILKQTEKSIEDTLQSS